MRQDFEFQPMDRTPNAAPDELIDLGRPRRLSNELLALLTVLAVVVGAGVWLATRGSSGTTPTAGRPSTAPSATAVGSGVDATACPPVSRCRTSDDLPAQVMGWVREYFPHAQPVAARLVISSGRLWFREVDTRVAENQLLVIVGRSPALPRAATSQTVAIGRTVTGYICRAFGRYSVQVQMEATQPHRPAMARLRALADDPRLRSLP